MTSSDPAASILRPRSPHPSDSFPPQDVLLVEHDPSGVRAIGRAFEGESGLKLIVVSSLAEARSSILERPPAIIVTGQVLLDGRGSQLVGPIEGKLYPVIVLARPANDGAPVDPLEGGAIDQVEMTAAGLADLPRAVHRGLREWRLLQQRRSAESALAGSESRVRAILDAIPDLILIHDREGRVLECEGGAGTELGGHRAELIGQDLTQLVVPRCAMQLAETILAVCADGKSRTALYETELAGAHRVFDSKLVRYEQRKVLAILRDITDRHQASAQLAKLSPREHDVLSLIVEGKTNKAIGVLLGIGIKTVETHRANIMKKLKARTVAELLKLAFAAERV
jgi:PAS domain S-box-containing protein